MSETIRINNLSTTYVEKLRPNNIFYNNNFLLCGIFYINLYSYDTYKTLINFSLPNIAVDSIEKISLFAYVDNIRISNNLPFSISISSAKLPFSTFTTNWHNQPAITPSNISIINLPSLHLGAYAEIDITNIVKNAYYNFNGIILESTANKYNSILRFSNTNSSTPPYILISYSPVNTAQTTNTVIVEEENSEPVTTTSVIVPSTNPEDLLQLKESISDLETKYNALKELINSSQSSVTPEANTISAESLASFEDKITSFNNILNTLNLNYDVLKNTLRQTDETISNLVNHLAEIEVSNSTTVTDIKEIKEWLRNIQLSINDATSSYSSSIDTLNNKLLSLETQTNSFDLETLKNDLAFTITSIKTLEDKIASLPSFDTTAYEKINTELTELQNKYQLLNTALNKITIEPLNMEN